MARWHDDRYDRDRDEHEGRGGWRGMGRRGGDEGRRRFGWGRRHHDERDERDMEPPRYGRGYEGDYERGEYDRGYDRHGYGGYGGGYDERERGYGRGEDRGWGRGRSYWHEDEGPHLTERDREYLEGRRWSREGRDYEGRWDEPGYRRRRGGAGLGYGGDRYGFDQGRVTFERRGEHHGRGPKGWTRSDDRIKEDVSERMAHHGRLDASDIEVSVEHGEVTLTGQVRTRMEKRLAEDIADDVNGVHDVHNRLTVQRETAAGPRQTREERTRTGGT